MGKPDDGWMDIVWTCKVYGKERFEFDLNVVILLQVKYKYQIRHHSVAALVIILSLT